MDAIRTDGLTKRYGKARGIEGVSLRVERGAFFGFIGPNGAGKSTTIRALLGLVRPTSGSARVLGLDAATERERILARVGYLPSETAFWPNMRVRDALRLSAGLRGKDCKKTAGLLCERLALDPSRRLDELSYGSRRKAAIVCALQHEPELLLLDEPTGGLDPLMQRELFAILRERNEAGATVFLSSHVLSEVRRYCDCAAILRDGRVVASGSVEALMRADAKRVSLRGHAPVDALPGVRGLRFSEGGASFLYAGETGALLAALSAGDVRDFTVTEPELEEVFLHYYEEGSEAK